MLKQLYFVPDIMTRYHCRSEETARRYMRDMGAKGRPLFVTEEMISAWEDSKRKPIQDAVVRDCSGLVRFRPTPAGMKIPRRK